MTRASVRSTGLWLPALLLVLAVGLRSQAPPAEPGLLFYLSGDRSLDADIAAGGDPRPNFVADVELISDGARGGALQCGHTQLLSYWAPGNIYAQRGTLAFSWRSREPVGPTAFPVFRVGYADHSSWDMVWLRIDYNGKSGFDAFVTDASLARQRVSMTMPSFPKPDQWVHLALAWDETRGIRFYVDGKLAGTIEGPTRLDAALDQFGPHSRIISPYQVQSAYNFVRGGDIDEVRIYDRMLSDENVVRLSKGEQPGSLPDLGRDISRASWRDEWWFRYGWNRPGDAPPVLGGGTTTIRKVEIHDVYDLKRWWWKGTDGIRETTWPGVFNRSRLPGRNDYFQLPDWDVYSTGGKTVTFLMPQEPWNHLEMAGAAFGTLEQVDGRDAKAAAPLFERQKGQERTFHRLTAPVTGRAVRFTNVEQETPIGEFGAYYVSNAPEPKGIGRLTYRLTGLAEIDQPHTRDLRAFINGRFAADERATMVALPMGAPRRARPATTGGLPIVHVVIPGDLRDEVTAAARGVPGRSRTIDQRPYAYGWMNMPGGLDGIAIDLPALDVAPTHGAVFPLNIQVKDPIWPLRTMLDVSVSVTPGVKQTVFLDTRNRLLRADTPLYLTIAGAGADFGVASLEGAEVRLIFTTREQTVTEQSIDRFTQARDLFAHTVEERPNSRRLSLYTRFETDLTDLFAADPDHRLGREYWYETNREQPRPAVTLGTPPAGVPLWAFRQGEWQRATKRFVNYFIDHRQIENGEFGGGLSDDGDLTNWWPGTAFTGATPEKITASLTRHMEAFYDQGMFTNGLSTIQTDELHSYEEGIQVLGQVMALDFGVPIHLERAMETARAIEKLTAVNAAGHRHIRSSYFSGTTIAEEGVWGWSKPSSYLILHPAIALVDYNGAPRVRKWLVELADGLLAHRKADANGTFVLRASVRFADDADIAAPSSERTWPLLWAAYRWTGDRKYLQPILDAGPRALGNIAGNALDIVGMRKEWGEALVKAAAAGNDPMAKHVAWQMTGDTKYLEALYSEQVEAASVRAFINSWGSVWTDRAQMNHAELQRSRLGGVALVRNAYVPGHVVSWWFAGTRDDERVAILVPDATPTHVRVVAFNMGATPILAKMTAWDVEPGTWTMRQATGAAPDGLPGNAPVSTVALERGGSVEVTFAPGAYTVLEFNLATKGTAYWARPDLGIAARDVVASGRVVTTTVHSLGAVATRGARLVIADRDGKEMGHASVPGLQAPIDLVPRKVQVKVTLAAGASLAGATVRIVPAGGIPEVTLANNSVRLPDNVGAVVPLASPAAPAAGPLKSRDDPTLRDPKLPTVFVVGDSTVKNHGAGEGWGDHMAPFFDGARIQVLNWAMGGRSTRSFIDEGRWTRVLAQMKAGDIVIVQFGHNDQSEITMDRGTLISNGSEAETVFSDRDGSRVSVGTFGTYVRQYVADARARGATVILCTPVPRNWWLDDGRFNNVMAEHSALVRGLGKELGVPVIDLNAPLSARYAGMGRRAVSSQWYTVGDNTHTNADGARVNAAAVIDGIRGLTTPLKGYLKP